MSATSGAVARAARAARGALPHGQLLTPEVWARRHRGIVVLLWLHTAALAAFGVARGKGLAHSVSEAAVVAVFALLAAHPAVGRRARSAAAVLGLVTSSAILVHLSGGVIEMHFHFFVMLGVITLYQDWLPFGLALGYVVIHHGLLGTLRPIEVYNHPAAWQQPWTWALIHGGFVLAASVASLVTWRLSETQATEISRLVSRLEGLARTDPLTGIPNRRVWDEELPRELDRARRMGTALCVAMIDLDHFKAYNDQFGHQAGDRVLKEAASVWRTQVRPTDLLARYGGEEFVLLLPTCALGDAIQIIERLRAATPLVTCSIGVASWDFRESPQALVERADQALYAAKAEGRNRYVTA
jgi:diguanylate cyclase (GGDEF)-like protein